MWKCSILDGKFRNRPSLCSYKSKIPLFFSALVVAFFMAVGLTAQTDTWLIDTAVAPMPDEAEMTLIDVPTLSENMSEADYESAEAQGTCPVLGVPLRGVETVAKINYNGRQFYVCHSGCALIFAANPDRYMANLQGTCPVCGTKLTEVDSPCKCTYHGRDVYVRDENCKKTFLANPDKYLKNLPQEPQP